MYMNNVTIPIKQFISLNDAECQQRIKAAKAALGERLVILGDHYQ